MGAGLPQSQVLEDRLNGRIIHNEGEDTHGVFAPGADQRFYFVYFPDQSCPCRSALFLIMGEVLFDRRYWGGLTSIFLSQATALVTVPAVISEKLLSLVWYMKTHPSTVRQAHYSGQAYARKSRG